MTWVEDVSMAPDFLFWFAGLFGILPLFLNNALFLYGIGCLRLSRGYGRFRVRRVCVFEMKRKPVWVRQQVLVLKALMPEAGCRQIAAVFNRRFAAERQMSVSKSFVANLVRDHVYEIRVLRRRIKHRVPKSQERNRVWGLDMTGKRDAQGRLSMILGILDHGSRRMLALQGLPNKTAWTLLGFLFLAIGRFGVPRAVRTDNEPVFTSALFGAGLRLAGIRHQRTLPGCPWMNGRIERFFGTLKEKLNRIVPENGKALQRLLGEFTLWYNAVRPHQHLYGFTPNEVWFGVNPYLTPPKQVGYFEGWNGMLRGFYMRR